MKAINLIIAAILSSLTVLSAPKSYLTNEIEQCSISFDFKSECVCDRYDDGYGDQDRYVLVYHDPDMLFEYEELVVDYQLYTEWCKAAAENRIIRVRIVWDLKAEHFSMRPETYITWESETKIIYPEI